MKSVAIITPTIGKEVLWQCAQSVLDQTYKNIKHHIIIDGKENTGNVCKSLRDKDLDYLSKYEVVELNENVGAKGFYGHRIYAAWSFLVNQDYVMFLDEDNWLDQYHVESCIDTIESNNLDWCFAYRNIHEKDGTYICRDECESRGVFHVDTSCFCLKREVATRVGGVWYGGWGQDRVFFHTIRQHYPKFASTYCYTLNYRLDGNPGSVTKEFFLQGNAVANKNVN